MLYYSIRLISNEDCLTRPACNLFELYTIFIFEIQNCMKA